MCREHCRMVWVVGFVLVAWLLGGRAEAASYPVIYAFGDSLSDAGNDWTATNKLLPISPPYSHGRFSNGPVWVQDLSLALGAGALKASLLGGTDFAFGAAESGDTLVHKSNIIDLPTQLIEFALTIQSRNPDALYTLWIGANDLLDILADTSLTPDQVTQAVGQIVTNQANFVTALVLLGGKHVLAMTVPDLGVVPTVTSRGPAVAAAATALSQTYNAMLVTQLNAVATRYRLDLTIVDVFTLIDGAIANPAKYHFTNVTSACWTGSYTGNDGTLCSKMRSEQNNYLFWDQLHPTAKAHALVGKQARSTLAANKLGR